MTVKQPSWIQASSHPADTDRLLLEALLNPHPAPVSGAGYGVGPGATELQVTENGTPNMSVNVAAGRVVIDGTENAAQGAYSFYNDATVNLAITAAHATLPRKDLVVARIRDAQYSGASNDGALVVVTGTAAASPAEPAVPANSVVLAMIDVPAADTAITNSQITDRRRRYSALGGIVACTSTTRPTTGLYEGLVACETDTDRFVVYSGSAWIRGPWFSAAGRTGCALRRVANQSIADNVETTISWDTEDFDSDGFIVPHATTGTTITIPAGLDGLYSITTEGQLPSDATTNIYEYILAGGITYLRNHDPAASRRFHMSLTIPLVAGNTVQYILNQDFTGPQNFTGRLFMYRIGA